ncbi:unnamed protein product [Prorocentrum cordatum]|uniref:SMP-LTD domain-containing protein n=1 Tax=Prorocentrum cordatum TaxID=2364126 RepID=A0ABN9QPI0_9DINO|nr:unnamed protein product [Polarella glacialis]
MLDHDIDNAGQWSTAFINDMPDICTYADPKHRTDPGSSAAMMPVVAPEQEAQGPYEVLTTRLHGKSPMTPDGDTQCKSDWCKDASIVGVPADPYERGARAADEGVQDKRPTDKRPARGKKGLRLELALDRFALDKAANAPSLRSLSSAMKLDIDFVVDERVTLQDLDNDPPELHLVASNVNMSEWETLNWLTWVSEKVWPNFKNGFEKMIRSSIEGARQGLPGPLKGLRLVQCSFGDAYPRFGPICASSAKDEEVQLDIGLSYSTETSIVLEVGYLAFGINHLKIGGMLSMKFTPLLEEVPVFSAMQLFFLNSPEIDIRFTNVLEVANTSFLMDKIRSVIHQALTGMLVVPNVLNINWADPSNDRTP